MDEADSRKSPALELPGVEATETSYAYNVNKVKLGPTISGAEGTTIEANFCSTDWG